MKKYIFTVLLIISITCQAYGLNLTTSVSSPVVALGHEFELTISADENVNSSPDLSSLQSTFKIFSTSVSRQSFFNNGQQSSSTSWKIKLIPLALGKQEIMPIKVGNTQTNPISIEVVKQDQTQPSSLDSTRTVTPYLIDGILKTDNKPVYVQQQILYDVIIKDDGRINSGEPRFENVDSNLWVIKSLGQPEILQNSDGTQRTIKFSYALFAQKSGTLQIPTVVFEGSALGAQNDMPTDFDLFGNDIFQFRINMPSFFQINSPVRLIIPSKNIDILPAPQSFNGSWWLPANEVRLSSVFTQDDFDFRVGKAITREITLRAKGVLERQLPDLNFATSPDFKIYPQKSVVEETLENGEIVTIQKTNVTYIPQKSGKILLPELKVLWFDTKTQKIEETVLPAEEIDVKPSISENDKAPILQATPPEATQTDTKSLEPVLPKKDMTFLWIVLAFLAGLIVSFFLFRSLNKNPQKPQCETRQYPDYIIKKAYQGDFRSLRDALISWATGFFSESQINNLKDVATAADDLEFSEQIDILLSHLYQPDSQQIWNAKIFVTAFNRVIAKKNKKSKNNSLLPPLYD